MREDVRRVCPWWIRPNRCDGSSVSSKNKRARRALFCPRMCRMESLQRRWIKMESTRASPISCRTRSTHAFSRVRIDRTLLPFAAGSCATPWCTRSWTTAKGWITRSPSRYSRSSSPPRDQIVGPGWGYSQPRRSCINMGDGSRSPRSPAGDPRSASNWPGTVFRSRRRVHRRGGRMPKHGPSVSQAQAIHAR